MTYPFTPIICHKSGVRLYTLGCEPKEEFKQELERFQKVSDVKCTLDWFNLIRKKGDSLYKKGKRIFDFPRGVEDVCDSLNETLRKENSALVDIELIYKLLNDRTNIIKRLGNRRELKLEPDAIERFDVRGSELSDPFCTVGTYTNRKELYTFSEKSKKAIAEGNLVHYLALMDPPFEQYFPRDFFEGWKRKDYCEVSQLIELDIHGEKIKFEFTPDAAARYGNSLVIVDIKSGRGYKKYFPQLASYLIGLEKKTGLEGQLGVIFNLVPGELSERNLHTFVLDEELRQTVEDRIYESYIDLKEFEENPKKLLEKRDKNKKHCKECYEDQKKFCWECLEKIVSNI